MLLNKSSPVIYGPVPSRRLGRSLGIVNLFPKQCSYACIYCQLGRTKKTRINRGTFYTPSEIYQAVSEKIDKIYQAVLPVDYLTFVPTGEPAIDENLGAAIQLLKPLGIKIAIISNASMLFREDVQNDFLMADFISLKVDAITKDIWYTLSRPNQNLDFDRIMKAVVDFSKIYRGTLVTETMFVRGINDTDFEANLLADYISLIDPDIAYLAFPIRPPAEKWVNIPEEGEVLRLYQIFRKRLNRVEYLIDFEGSDVDYDHKDLKASILDITRVHPLREDTLKQMLDRAKEKEYIINELLIKKQIIKAHYLGDTFYVGRILSKGG
jgi:wyosine [tRNA(Phe)-imidazoG37] synthetase (radical SAM superfamily)